MLPKNELKLCGELEEESGTKRMGNKNGNKTFQYIPFVNFEPHEKMHN